MDPPTASRGGVIQGTPRRPSHQPHHRHGGQHANNPQRPGAGIGLAAEHGAEASGKSTAMNILGCLDRPSSGSYRLNGQPVEHLSDDALADLRNRELGFVFQQFHLLQELTALENVMLPMVYAGVPAEQRRERALAALERVGLGARVNNRPNQLSGGQQQRVAVARAIINQPKLLLADEPTGALDSRTTGEVLDLFDELHREQGMTILLVTHEHDVAERAERVVHFHDGRLVESGAGSQL